MSPGQRVLVGHLADLRPIPARGRRADARPPPTGASSTPSASIDAVDERGEPQIIRGVNHLQELNSTLRSYKALLDALDSTAG